MSKAKKPTKLNDWELEDYISEHRQDLYKKYWDGEISLARVRQETKIKWRP